MARKNEMLEVLYKRQTDLLSQIQEVKNEIELYEEDDTSAEEEDLRVLEEDLANVSIEITNLENQDACEGEPMDPYRYGDE